MNFAILDILISNFLESFLISFIYIDPTKIIVPHGKLIKDLIKKTSLKNEKNQ